MNAMTEISRAPSKTAQRYTPINVDIGNALHSIPQVQGCQSSCRGQTQTPRKQSPDIIFTENIDLSKDSNPFKILKQ